MVYNVITEQVNVPVRYKAKRTLTGVHWCMSFDLSLSTSAPHSGYPLRGVVCFLQKSPKKTKFFDYVVKIHKIKIEKLYRIYKDKNAK